MERLEHSTLVITLDTYSQGKPGVQEDTANRLEEALRQSETPAEKSIGLQNVSIPFQTKEKRAFQPSFSNKIWQEREDSNPRPLVLEFCGVRPAPSRCIWQRTLLLKRWSPFISVTPWRPPPSRSVYRQFGRQFL